ncbi:hypothetical protein GF340_05935, partial [Candidatus Peregrinibacteria bacterium]|nr:hypothetical protein [Candidatus Peregrinibacteria bacterium]
MKIKFKIDSYHLAYKLWVSKALDQKDAQWTKLLKRIESKYSDYAGYCFFNPAYVAHVMDWSNYNSKQADVLRDKPVIDKIFNEIFDSKVFKEARNETVEYSKRVKKEWSRNKKWLKVLQEYMGIEMPINVEVYLLHPDLRIGSFIKQNKMEWGNQDNFDNYQFIGICHELMHLVTEKEFYKNKTEKDQWIMHAIIYLTTDEELRIRMNDSQYFDHELSKY